MDSWLLAQKILTSTVLRKPYCIPADILSLRWMGMPTDCFSRYYKISRYFRPPWADDNRVTVCDYAIPPLCNKRKWKKLHELYIYSKCLCYLTLWTDYPDVLSVLSTEGIPYGHWSLGQKQGYHFNLSHTPFLAIFFSLTFLLSLSHYCFWLFLTGWWILSQSMFAGDKMKRNKHNWD